MNPTQTCPHCGAVNKVAGLFAKGPLDKSPYRLKCYKCDQEYEPVDDPIFKMEWERKVDR